MKGDKVSTIQKIGMYPQISPKRDRFSEWGSTVEYMGSMEPVDTGESNEDEPNRRGNAWYGKVRQRETYDSPQLEGIIGARGRKIIGRIVITLIVFVLMVGVITPYIIGFILWWVIGRNS